MPERAPKRENTLSRFWPSKKQRQSTDPLQPVPHIAEAFRKYIRNHIPARLIDTSTFAFVERSAVFDMFVSEITAVTDKDIERRMNASSADTRPEANIYITPRKVALRETIRNVVKYAIFSHRWTDSEPSYQHISSSVSSGGLRVGKRRNSKNAGLAKLVRFCKAARALGYKLVWSDTCCIDKDNITEHSEAIQAMFKWYAHAHLCIIHLATSLSLLDFEREEWFKRGWTLQELLAPKRIKLYDRNWRPFTDLPNDKDDPEILSALSAVTGIPRDVVVADNSHGIKGRSVSEIMSWASTRETTRVEDAAYCLFGLFNISLPITYGEGEKAFPRLVEALLARCRTWDVFAWAGDASSSHPALPSSPACYPRWDEEIIRGEVGMTYELTLQGLQLTSVPLIPVAFASAAKGKKGSYEVTLRPRPERVTALGMYSDITVVCGSHRRQQLCDATDLHACILNYEFFEQNHGQLRVGRTYVCFLLHVEVSKTGKSTWLKFATDNVLVTTCKGVPVERMSPLEGSPDMEKETFALQLSTTHIRAPRTQSTMWP